MIFKKSSLFLNSQSEEKLELTDKLSHEKFLNKELQNRLDNLRSVDHHHDHHNHNDHSDCNSFDKEKLEPLINDSQEIEELKKIILQLQDDKVELKSRLNLITSQVNLKEMDHMTEKHLSEHEENEEEHQDAKFRLQQMEEKVRKTMNEVAILDEEKEKLEHLVLQLQGETETIG